VHKALHAGLSLLLVSSSFVGATNAKSPAAKNGPTADDSATTVASHEVVGLPNVDVRRDPETNVINGANVVASKSAIADHTAGLTAFLARVPAGDPDNVRVDLYSTGIPKSVVNFEGVLSEARSGSPDAIAREFLTENADLFGLSAREVTKLKLTVDDVDQTTGVAYLKYEQTVKGVPVFDSETGVTINARGEVVIVNQGQIIPGARVSTRAALTPEAAIARAFEHCGVEVSADQIRPSAAKRAEASEFTYYESPLGEGHEDIIFQKTILNVGGEPRLAYRAYVDKNGLEWYDTLVDANTGELLVRFNIVSDVQASVFTSNPGISATGSRSLVDLVPVFGVPASDAWVGSTSLSTGNNVDAYLDRDSSNTPDTVTTTSTGTNPGLTSGHADSSKASPAGQFTFFYASGTSTAPTAEQANAVTNLWYFNNYMHDWMYSLGFTESARNFQTNNYGRGGVGNDAVKAEAQDGSGTNNANFSTPADGSSGRMQQYIFTGNRDSDLDGDVVLHEYGHGVSNRLIGNGSGLGGTQSGAMGEGWSDYWACSNYNDGVMGEYVVNSSAGIRRAPYTVPAATVHDSYADVGSGGFEVHNDGEVWAAALWDLNRTLGKSLTDSLVLNGMKNTVTSPSMLNARDGIIAADNAVNGGTHVCQIWTVFARHGMGFSAVGNDGTTHTAATNLPSSCGGTPPPACSSSTTTISSGTPGSGSLATTDCTSTTRPTANCYYDNFTFSATAGTAYTITLTSSAFDTYLYLLSGTTVLASDDDGNGGTNSKIVYTPSASGTLTIHCTSYSAGATGAYTVSLTGGGTTPPPGGELLTNGGFDTGSFSPWTVAANTSLTTTAPQAGGYAAKMLGIGSTASTSFSQGAAFPATGATKTLRFYLKISSAETTTSTAYDKLTVRITNSAGTVVSTLATYSNLNKGTYAGWGLVTLTIPASAAVSGNRMSFAATEDSSLQTTFNIDSCSIQ
jgi:Zn-dependent metalloprotease